MKDDLQTQVIAFMVMLLIIIPVSVCADTPVIILGWVFAFILMLIVHGVIWLLMKGEDK